jgi:hypothetical protein
VHHLLSTKTDIEFSTAPPPVRLPQPGSPEIGDIGFLYGAQYQIWGVRIDAGSRKDISAGVEYTLRRINASETYTWSVREGLVVRAGSEAR